MKEKIEEEQFKIQADIDNQVNGTLIISGGAGIGATLGMIIAGAVATGATMDVFGAVVLGAFGGGLILSGIASVIDYFQKKKVNWAF